MLLVELEMYKNNPMIVIDKIKIENRRMKPLGSIFFVLLFLFFFLAAINTRQIGILSTKEL